MKFLVDGMLLRVGKYLRFLGYDTRIEKQFYAINFDEVVDRIFVTASKKHYNQWPGGKKILIQSPYFNEQLAQLQAELNLEAGSQLLSRCSRCNTLLESVPTEEIRDRVPPQVAKYFDHFYRCPQCGKIYWEGGHVQRLIQKLQQLGFRVQNRKGDTDD